MCSLDKPYKLLQRSPKGSMYDKLICIKCCITVQRSNYSKHKTTEKHIRLHKNTDKYDAGDAEIYKHKQLAKVMKYHKEHQKSPSDTETSSESEQETEIEPESEHESETESEPEEQPMTLNEKMRQYRNEPTKKSNPKPLFAKYDPKTQNGIIQLYMKAKRLYAGIDPRDTESIIRVRSDLNMFEKLIEGETYEKPSQLNNMMQYYLNLN